MSTNAPLPDEYARFFDKDGKIITDPCDILGLSLNFTEADLKKAYRTLALAFHPDKNKTPLAHSIFQAITKANVQLSDPRSLRLYLFEKEEEAAFVAAEEKARAKVEAEIRAMAKAKADAEARRAREAAKTWSEIEAEARAKAAKQQASQSAAAAVASPVGERTLRDVILSFQRNNNHKALGEEINHAFKLRDESGFRAYLMEKAKQLQRQVSDLGSDKDKILGDYIKNCAHNLTKNLSSKLLMATIINLATTWQAVNSADVREVLRVVKQWRDEGNPRRANRLEQALYELPLLARSSILTGPMNPVKEILTAPQPSQHVGFFRRILRATRPGSPAEMATSATSPTERVSTLPKSTPPASPKPEMPDVSIAIEGTEVPKLIKALQDNSFSHVLGNRVAEQYHTLSREAFVRMLSINVNELLKTLDSLRSDNDEILGKYLINNKGKLSLSTRPLTLLGMLNELVVTINDISSGEVADVLSVIRDWHGKGEHKRAEKLEKALFSLPLAQRKCVITGPINAVQEILATKKFGLFSTPTVIKTAENHIDVATAAPTVKELRDKWTKARRDRDEDDTVHVENPLAGR